MDKLIEALPFLIPFIIAQIALTGYSLWHVLTHNTYKNGSRTLWVVLSFINFIGPILYFLLGKEDA